MAERTSITQLLQIGIETTPGTAVAANRLMPSVKLTSGFDGSFTEQRGSGYKFPINQIPGKEFSKAAISGQPTYDELLYLLVSGGASFAAGVQQGATTAYLYTLPINSTAEDTIKTLTAELGSSVRAHKIPGMQTTELTLSGTRDEISLGGSMIGKQTVDGITLTASPTAVPQIPILPKHVDIYMDPLVANIGTTKITRALSWEIGIRNRYLPLWVVDSAQASYVAAMEAAIDSSFKMKVEADAQGMGLLTTARAGTKQFIRVVATSDQLAGTAFPYKLQWDMCCEVKGWPSTIDDQDGVYAIEWEFSMVHDAGWGKATTVALTNTRATL